MLAAYVPLPPAAVSRAGRARGPVTRRRPSRPLRVKFPVSRTRKPGPRARHDGGVRVHRDWRHAAGAPRRGWARAGPGARPERPSQCQPLSPRRRAAATVTVTVTVSVTAGPRGRRRPGPVGAELLSVTSRRRLARWLSAGRPDGRRWPPPEQWVRPRPVGRRLGIGQSLA
jgi:hypothetical protein